MKIETRHSLRSGSTCRHSGSPETQFEGLVVLNAKPSGIDGYTHRGTTYSGHTVDFNIVDAEDVTVCNHKEAKALTPSVAWCPRCGSDLYLTGHRVNGRWEDTGWVDDSGKAIAR